MTSLTFKHDDKKFWAEDAELFFTLVSNFEPIKAKYIGCGLERVDDRTSGYLLSTNIIKTP